MTFVILGIHSGNTVFAATLEQAKSQGFLGETVSGYLGLVTPSAPPEMKALMNEVNQKRKNKYQEIAKRNKTTLKACRGIGRKDRTIKNRARALYSVTERYVAEEIITLVLVMCELRWPKPGCSPYPRRVSMLGPH